MHITMVGKQNTIVSSDARESPLDLRADNVLHSGGQSFQVADGISFLEECIVNYGRLPLPEMSIHKIQAVGANVEAHASSADVETVNGFMEKALCFFVEGSIDMGSNTKQCFEVALVRCVFRRIIFSVLFTLLNSMTRGDRKAIETDLFMKHASMMEASTHRLFENIDFEEKISLVELLWRGIRRAGNAKATRAMSTKPRVPFRGIKLLNPKGFEKEAIRWLENSGCLTESHGLYKVKGNLTLHLSRKQIFEYQFTEIILTAAILRAHLRTDDEFCLKVEVPFAHMTAILVEEKCLEVSFKLVSPHFNAAVLWSLPIQERLTNLIDADDLVVMKLCFPDNIPLHLADVTRPIGEVINAPLTHDPAFAVKALSQRDEPSLYELDSESEDQSSLREKMAVLPGSLTYASSGRRKVESRIRYNDSAITDNYKLIDKVAKRMEFHSSPSSLGYNPASVSLSTELSNSVSSCEKPYTDTLLEPSHRAMHLHGHSTAEPLMTSLEHYREAKAKEMLSIFKRIFREESDQAKAEISKLCAAQEAQRREVQEAYKREVESLVIEIEKNHQDLMEQLKTLLTEFDTLRNNSVCKDGRKLEKFRTTEGSNPMIANCSGLVETTESAIKEIDDVIERIKTHYVKKKIDCSRALEGL